MCVVTYRDKSAKNGGEHGKSGGNMIWLHTQGYLAGLLEYIHGRRSFVVHLPKMYMQ